MREVCPDQGALAVAAVIVLAVGAGAFGISKRLNVTTVHYHAANTAADLKFGFSVLGSFNDQYASATVRSKSSSSVHPRNRAVGCGPGGVDAGIGRWRGVVGRSAPPMDGAQ
jgi:hypothetical protein